MAVVAVPTRGVGVYMPCEHNPETLRSSPYVSTLYMSVRYLGLE